MSPRYISAKRGTQDFARLIQGTFSSTERALPIQSLRIGKLDEEVTFEIIPISQVPTYSLLETLKSFLQIKKVFFVLFPLFFFVMRDWNQPFLSSVEMVLILAGIVLTLLAVQIQVDSEDFVSGYDRIRGHRGQKVLSQGVRTVFELKSYVKASLVLAIVLGTFPLLLEPLRILAFLVGLAFILIGYKKGVAEKNRFIRDVFLSLIAGPCLAYGIVPQTESLSFGLVWSFFVFFELQLEHFQFYFAQTEAGERNLMTWKSFDQATKILWSVWAISILVYVFYRALQAEFTLWIGSVFILAFMSLVWKKDLYKLSTPAGSEIDRVCEKGHQLYLTFIMLWVVELIFQAFIAPWVFSWFK